MKTHKDIISAWPSIEDFTFDMNVKFSTASAWKYRSSIPVDYWPRLIKAGKNRGINLTASMLVKTRGK